jgi:hypothetical protein
MFEISVYGGDEEELTDREKEMVAEDIHYYLQEDFDVDVDGVGVEGYGGGLP